MSILITGGAGYIGSHTCVELLKNGEEIIVVDNFINSNMKSIENIKKITQKDFKFYEIDLLNYNKLENIFKENSIDEVVHFAGLKAVGESVEDPIRYYNNNIIGTINLLQLMKKYNCNKIVFSSSATVYGTSEIMPIKENFPLS